MSEERFCDSPWNHLNINSVGYIKPCCVFLKGRKPPEDANLFEWYFKAYEDLKAEGITHAGCGFCKGAEDYGMVSRRQRHIESGRGNNPDKKLTFLDVSFGNTCNLKCRMCESRNSTKWISDEKFLLENNFDIDREHYGKQEMSPERVNQIVEYLNNVDVPEFKLEIKGGEPFVTTAFLDFIEQLTPEFKNKCTINIFTNGTGVSDYYLKKLNDFKLVDLRLSIEAVGPLYNYIRGGEKHSVDDCITTLGRMYKHIENFKVGVSVTITMYNIFNLHELRTKLEEYKPGASDAIVFNNISHKPVYLAPGILPQHWKDKLIEMYKDEPDFSNFIKYLKKSETDLELCKKFKDFTLLLDKKRNENLCEVEPRFKEMLDEF